jgi:hypothetical protein
MTPGSCQRRDDYYHESRYTRLVVVDRPQETPAARVTGPTQEVPYRTARAPMGLLLDRIGHLSLDEIAQTAQRTRAQPGYQSAVVVAC